MHYETIVDWFYVEPGSKESKIFKPGWNAFRLPNFNHPFQKLRTRRLLRQTKEILKRKEVNWEELKKILFQNIKTTRV